MKIFLTMAWLSKRHAFFPKKISKIHMCLSFQIIVDSCEGISMSVSRLIPRKGKVRR